MRQTTRQPLVQIMACHLSGIKPLSKPMMDYCQFDHWEQTLVKFQNTIVFFEQIENVVCKTAALCLGLHVLRAVQGDCDGQLCNSFSIHSLRTSDAYMRHQSRPSLVQIMACRLLGSKPLSEPMLHYCQLDLMKKLQSNCIRSSNIFFQENELENVVCCWHPFCVGLNIMICVSALRRCDINFRHVMADQIEGTILSEMSLRCAQQWNVM